MHSTPLGADDVVVDGLGVVEDDGHSNALEMVRYKATGGAAVATVGGTVAPLGVALVLHGEFLDDVEGMRGRSVRDVELLGSTESVRCAGGVG